MSLARLSYLLMLEEHTVLTRERENRIESSMLTEAQYIHQWTIMTKMFVIHYDLVIFIWYILKKNKGLILTLLNTLHEAIS